MDDEILFGAKKSACEFKLSIKLINYTDTNRTKTRQVKYIKY
jgi:hypothetical protein